MGFRRAKKISLVDYDGTGSREDVSRCAARPSKGPAPQALFYKWGLNYY